MVVLEVDRRTPPNPHDGPASTPVTGTATAAIYRLVPHPGLVLDHRDQHHPLGLGSADAPQIQERIAWIFSSRPSYRVPVAQQHGIHMVGVAVDADLLAAARRTLGLQSDTEVVAAALTGLLRRRQLEAIDALSHLPVDLDPPPHKPQT